MKLLFKIALAIVLLAIVYGCEDSTSPSKDPTINLVGELESRYVNKVFADKINELLQLNEVDSIKIVRTRILLSNMKLFIDSSDSNLGKVVKTGPFVFDINETSGSVSLLTSSVPSGKYEKLKFEFHRFSSSEASQLSSDPIFMDFATADRYSVLIEGITYKNGNPTLFYFKAQTTANLSLKFEPTLNLTDNSVNTIALQINPNLFFKKWELILDPNDPKNSKDIENTLVNTIKAIKK